MNDIYQERYLAHQKRKRKALTSTYGTPEFRKYKTKEQKIFFDILSNRNSQRTFNQQPVDIMPILAAIGTAPSSCDRQGVQPILIKHRDDKDLLSGLLVGGIGWIYRAEYIILLVADMKCYKNPAERHNMPYLDAGVIAQTVYLASEVMNYGCCFVNPNIREDNQSFFKERFGLTDEHLFCGALAIGRYDLKHKKCLKVHYDF